MKPAPIREIVANNLKRWMNENLALDTQTKVADASGIGQTTIGRILNAATSPTLEVLQDIAQAFGKDVADLVAKPETTSFRINWPKYPGVTESIKQHVEAILHERADLIIRAVIGNRDPFEGWKE